MRILKISAIILVGLFLFYLTCVYKDVILSIPFKKGLSGKVAYSVKGYFVSLLDLQTGKKRIIYRVPEETLAHLGFVSNPSFSPDGKSIVFSQSQHLFDNSLYIMDESGMNIRQFLLSPSIDDENYSSPSWSPNGDKIAFTEGKNDRQGVYVVDIKDKVIRKLVDIKPKNNIQPSWSPDGGMIAFASYRETRKYLDDRHYEVRDAGGVYVIDVNSGSTKKYVDLASQPAWSPSGRLIAYEKKDGYYVTDLYDDTIYDVTLIIPIRRPLFCARISYPIRWSPDGKYLVFCKQVWPGIVGIYVASLDNLNRHIRVATEDENIIGMSWGE